VVQGFIDIFGSWIDRYGIDGFRIDTARHVNPEFWAKFAPAMRARAKAKGIPNFHIFGEVANDDFQPGLLAQHTQRDKLPAVLDFAFKQGVLRTIAGEAPTEVWRDFFSQDVLYNGGEQTALQLPTFIGNHDQGRFGFYVRKAFPNATDDEVLKRVTLAHVMMMTARGVPTIYYGDEQGFAGDGGDQDAREDMFPSQVAVYNDNRLIGSTATTALSNFGTSHPLYGAVRELAAVRKASSALRSGSTVFRAGSDGPGLLAFSRILNGREVLVVLNTATKPIEANVVVEASSQRFTRLAGACPTAARALGSVRVSLPALGYAVCDAR
jgi:glycosidase